MLGITTADAVLVGTLIVAVLAAWRGATQGDSAKRQSVQTASMVSIAGGIIDANQFEDYVKVADKLAIAINKHADALNRQHDVKHTNALEELAEKIDDLRSARAENPHRRK
jgi:hypothetical protein